ncbi:MAG: AMP-binding protein [Paludibacteraceae bacterium]|nr:AMP-binding protein [Paludibacteraceae bacterium]
MNKRFLDYFENSITTNWNAPALNDYDGTTAFTYGEMAEKIARLHVLFEQVGLQKGDKIALCGRNSSMWAVDFLAVTSYGCVAVAILSDFDSEGIQALVNHSDAKLLLAGPLVWEQLNPDSMPNLIGILAIEELVILKSNQEQFEQGFNNWNSAFEAKYPQGYSSNDVHFERFDSELPVLINYTSGSTGSPKGVMLNWRSIDSNIDFSQRTIPNNSSDNLLSMLPMAHMFGLAIEILYQVAGGTHVTVLNKTPSPAVLMKVLSEVKPYMMLTVPLVIEKIFKAKIFPAIHKPLVRILWYTPGINRLIHKKVYDQLMNAFGGHLRYLIIGGAALNHEVEKCLKTIKFPFCVGYGMTECAPLICYEDWTKFKLRTCGKAVDGIEIRIDSANPQREVGEILVRGDNVMMGYYKNQEATDAAFTADGWMRTGDLGVIDKDGHLSIRGRSKSMILGPSGQNIYPEEIEGKVNNLPYVIESVVVEREGKLVALVYADTDKMKQELPGKTSDEVMEELRVRVNKLLPLFCRLSKLELVDKEFEKTPKRSIKRYLYN